MVQARTVLGNDTQTQCTN